MFEGPKEDGQMLIRFTLFNKDFIAIIIIIIIICSHYKCLS